MAAPSTPSAALAAAQQAVGRGRYSVISHFDDRCEERRVSMQDVKAAIKNATSCTPYSGHQPRQGGSCWRVTGTAIDGDVLTMGIEVWVDHLGGFVVFITTF